MSGLNVVFVYGIEIVSPEIVDELENTFSEPNAPNCNPNPIESLALNGIITKKIRTEIKLNFLLVFFIIFPHRAGQCTCRHNNRLYRRRLDRDIRFEALKIIKAPGLSC